jgi:hypothetical protein
MVSDRQTRASAGRENGSTSYGSFDGPTPENVSSQADTSAERQIEDSLLDPQSQTLRHAIEEEGLDPDLKAHTAQLNKEAEELEARHRRELVARAQRHADRLAARRLQQAKALSLPPDSDVDDGDKTEELYEATPGPDGSRNLRTTPIPKRPAHPPPPERTRPAAAPIPPLVTPTDTAALNTQLKIESSIRAKEPAPYAAKSVKEHQTFRYACETVFRLKKVTYTEDRHKILWATSYLKTKPMD